MKAWIVIVLLALVVGYFWQSNQGNDFDSGWNAWVGTVQGYGVGPDSVYPGSLGEQKALLNEMQSLQKTYTNPEFLEWVSLYGKGLRVQSLMLESQQHLIASNKSTDCAPGSEFRQAIDSWSEANRLNEEWLVETVSRTGSASYLSKTQPYFSPMESIHVAQEDLLKEGQQQFDQFC